MYWVTNASVGRGLPGLAFWKGRIAPRGSVTLQLLKCGCGEMVDTGDFLVAFEEASRNLPEKSVGVRVPLAAPISYYYLV